MRKATLVVDKFYQNNRIFDLDDKVVNRDNCMYPFYLLKEKFNEMGIDLSTQDINKIPESDIVIYNEMPRCLPQGKEFKKSFLLILESEIIRPDNWDKKKHAHFNKIFIWHDEYVDNIKYIKINYSFKIPQSFEFLQKRDILCTLIAGNKKHIDKRELYSERIKAINWFEEFHPNDFDFYGFGWDKYFFGRPLSRLNRFSGLTSLLAKKYRTYKGIVNSKKETLSKYKFSICYENARDIPGYITEKIFDCFFAGTIPIYWGAPNITKYIPKNCFIDRRGFNNIEEVYYYISTMDDVRYMEYIESIKNYLRSDNIKQFSAETFAKTVINECLK